MVQSLNPETLEVENAMKRPETPPEVALRRALQVGALGGVVAVMASAMGLVESLGGRIIIHLGMGAESPKLLSLGYTLLLLVLFGAGYLAGKPPPVLEGMPVPRRGFRNGVAGLIAGLLAAGVLAAFVVIANLINLRPVFLNISPTLLDLLTFGQGLSVGLALLLAGGTVLGALGGGTHLLPDRWREPTLLALAWVLGAGLLQDLVLQLFRGLKVLFLGDLMFEGTGGLSLVGAAVVLVVAFALYFYFGARQRTLRERISGLPATQQRRLRYGGVVLFLIVIAVLPQILGRYMSEILDLVGLFLLMGLGLNIVIGYAGLLDLGYVAFFAVGAYATAILTSPTSPYLSPELTFWLAIPFVMLAAAFAGILVGTPVLRMRGDYLAIVTLGFGEIARLLAQSDWLKPLLGGAQGILSIPNIPVGPFELNTPQQLFYPIVGFCLLAVYISWRLQDSRIGRGWMAMREDEDVAGAMGVNIVTAKLMAFVTGAVLASFSGAIFAMKIGSIFPHSFKIQLSITVLVLIIVGGMGSIPGVMIGAFVLVGLPELLREFDEFRELFYGILLIVMMRLKPEGLLPSVRRARELHEEEMLQDAWASKSDA